jgi:hypothetical protein
MQDQGNVPLKCFVNGYARTVNLSEAHRFFWKARLGWLRPLEWIRVDHGKNARQGNGADLMQDRVARFAWKLLTRGSLALRVDDDCLGDEHGNLPGRGTVAAWACRFANMFKSARVLEHVRVADEFGIRELAYRLKPGIDWLLVVGVDSKSPIPDTAVDWTVFLTPPCGQEHAQLEGSARPASG